MKKIAKTKNAAVITGIGMLTPLGVSKEENWQNLVAGNSGIRPVTLFDASKCQSRIAGQVPDKFYELEKKLFPAEFFERSFIRTRLCLAAAREAVEDAKIDLDGIEKEKCSVITGSGGTTFGDLIPSLAKDLSGIAFSQEMLDSLSASVGVEFGFRGPCFNIATACSSGACAIAAGLDYIRIHGGICLAIGFDSILRKGTIDGFCHLMALSKNNGAPEKASRPFDKNRNGFVLAEGACALLLESYQHARQRDARIYAVVSGSAVTSEAFNILAPEPEGTEMAVVMEDALKRSGLPKERIGYVNAHGTSTFHNDRAETAAIKKVFAERAYQIPVSSQKSMMGHSIGAAGAIECAVTALSIHHGIITPTINYETFDPDCDLDYVPNQSRNTQQMEAAISNSFAFGGHNVTLVLEHEQAFSA